MLPQVIAQKLFNEGGERTVIGCRGFIREGFEVWVNAQVDLRGL